MARTYKLNPLFVLALLMLATARQLQPTAASASSIPVSSHQSRALLAASPTPSTSDDAIAVPRATLGSILASFFRWPSSILSGLGSSSSTTSQFDAGDNHVFNTKKTNDSTAAGSSSASGLAGSSISDAGAAGVPQMFQPLTDAGIAAINRLLSGNESSDGPYHFDTGLPPLQELVVLNTTSQDTAVTLSADRLQRLARLSEPLGWVIRTFSVSGDALLKLRLSTDLQLIIRDVISNSISQSAAIPEEQVLTFAASNVSISLGFDGVDWPSTDVNATADAHPGLAAVRDAVAGLAGGFDPQHVVVSFLAPLSTAAAPAAAVTNGWNRRMLQAPTADAVGIQQQHQVTVYATFYNLDPANSTSLLQALGKQCSLGGGSNATNSSANPLFAPLTALTPGVALTPACQSEFQAEFTRQGVKVSNKSFAVTPTGKPQATVDLSVAVGFTNDQTVQNLHEKTGGWLNSSALNDILAEFNLTAVPTDFTEYLYDPVTGTFPQLPGLNLSSLMAKLMPAPGGDAGAAVEHSTDAGGKAGAVSKAMITGITVAAVTSVLALGGFVGLLLRHRRLAAAAAAGQNETHSSTGGDASSGNRRRRRRPRVYHSKYLTATETAANSGDAAELNTDTVAAGGQQKHHLERGDSVSSAVHFEAEDAASDTGSCPSAAGQQQQQQQRYASSSCDDSLAASSSSADVEGGPRMQLLRQQRVVELQLYRAAGPLHGSGAASAYSLMHDRAGSSSLYEIPSSSDSREPTGAPLGPTTAAADDSSYDAISSRYDHKGLIRAVLSHESASGLSDEVMIPIAAAPLPGQHVGLVIRTMADVVSTDALAAGIGSCSSSTSRLGMAAASTLRNRLPHSVSATLLADAAGAVLAQQALARSHSAAGTAVHSALSTSSGGRLQRAQHTVTGQRVWQHVLPGAVDHELTCSLPAKAAAASATTTPPATPVADIAALFAAMDEQLAASAPGESSAGREGVQPLGLSCWHHGAHVSGFIVPEAAAAGHAVMPHHHKHHQHTAEHQQPKPTAGGWVSPFGVMEQQRECRRSSGCGSLSRFALQQQHQARHSSGGSVVSMLSPFASEKEQQRVSSSGCGDLAASFAQQQQGDKSSQHQSSIAAGAVVSPFALVIDDMTRGSCSPKSI